MSRNNEFRPAHRRIGKSHAILDRALELGINFIDTANVYGWKMGEGITEQIIGHWFAKGNKRREQVVFATKVYGKMGEGPNQRRLSAYHTRQACEDSLRRLQTDHIDLYQVHHVDRESPWEEIWQAMEQLGQQGKVLYIGSSNFAGWQIAQAQCKADDRFFMGLVSDQSLNNLKDRMIELEVIPARPRMFMGAAIISDRTASCYKTRVSGRGLSGESECLEPA